MSYTNTFKIRVAVVLVVDNHLLVCQQNNHPFWVLPGGTLEPGEGIETCAIREMREEVGLTVTLIKLLYVADWVTPTRQVHEVYFLGEAQTDTQTTQTLEANIQQVKWVTLQELDALPLQPMPVKAALLTDWPNYFKSQQAQVLGVYI